MTTPTGVPVDQLPVTIRDVLAARSAGDPEAAIRAFTPTAVVVDDGTTYRGAAEVRRFLTKAGSQFTYTTTLVGAERVDDENWVAVNRLEGDFPGGVVELRYRFTMAGELVAELTIAP